MDEANLDNYAINLRGDDLLERINAARELLKLGSGGVQVIIDTLDESKDPATINLCIETLDAIGKSAKPACQSIIKKLSHSEPIVRNSCYQALKNIGSDSPKTSKFVIEKIMKSIKLEKNDYIIVSMIEVLLQYPNMLEHYFLELVQMINRSSPSVNAMLLLLLSELKVHESKTIRVFKKFLYSSQRQLSSVSALCLLEKKLDDLDKNELIEKGLYCLKDEAIEIKRIALSIFWAHKKKPQVWQTIRDLFKSERPDHQLLVLDFFAKHDVDDNKRCPFLIDLFFSNEIKVQNETMRVLCKLGNQAFRIAKPLMKSLKEQKDEKTILRLLITLSHITPKEVSNRVTLLKSGLDDPDWEIRFRSAAAISKIGYPEIAISHLSEELVANHDHAKIVVASFLSTFGNLASKAIGPMIRVVVRENDFVASRVIKSLLNLLETNCEQFLSIFKKLSEEDEEKFISQLKKFPSNDSGLLFLALFDKQSQGNPFNNSEISFPRPTAQTLKAEPSFKSFFLIDMINALGKSGESSIKDLFRVLGREAFPNFVRYQAAEILLENFSEELSSYREIISGLFLSDDSFLREKAIELVLKSKEKENALALLLSVFNDENPLVKYKCESAIKEIFSEGGPEFKKVASLMNHKNKSIRLNACRMLGSFSENFDANLNILNTALKDPDLEVAETAKNSIEIIQSLKMLESKDEIEKDIATDMLVDKRETSVWAISRRLFSKQKEIKQGAMAILDKMGVFSSKASKDLLSIVDNDKEDREIRLKAINSLSYVANNCLEWSERISEKLFKIGTMDTSKSVRLEAARAFRVIDSFDEKILESELKKLKSEEIHSSEKADLLDFIANIGPKAKSSLKTLKALADGDQSDLKERAILALSQVDPKSAKDFRDTLLNILKNAKNDSVLIMVSRAMISNRDLEPAVDILCSKIQGLKDENLSSAIALLAESKSPSVINPLINLLKDESLLEEIGDALLSIGSEAERNLKIAIKNDREEISRNASKILSRFELLQDERDPEEAEAV